MTCTEDRDGAIIDMDATMRDLGDVHRYPARRILNWAFAYNFWPLTANPFPIYTMHCPLFRQGHMKKLPNRPSLERSLKTGTT